MYGALALIVFSLVATAKLWDLGPLGAMLWLAMIGGSAYALYSVWRAVPHVLGPAAAIPVARVSRAPFGTLS